MGGKPPWLMRALIRDYTKPGDLVCDPTAGAATTLIAACEENRRAVGAEVDPSTYAKGMARIGRGYTPSLDFGGAA
jgi:DNA modification methylase